VKGSQQKSNAPQSPVPAVSYCQLLLAIDSHCQRLQKVTPLPSTSLLPTQVQRQQNTALKSSSEIRACPQNTYFGTFGTLAQGKNFALGDFPRHKNPVARSSGLSSRDVT
jgi:hypothetical protein